MSSMPTLAVAGEVHCSREIFAGSELSLFT
jgi:hypothetical protein